MPRRIGGRLVKQGERAGESPIRVLDAQGCGGNLREFRLDEYGGRAGLASQSGVAGIGDKSNFGRARLLNSFHPCYFQLGVAVERGPQLRCQFA